MISVLTCVCNEEDLLPRWLEHYRFAERHVMVDAKTTDRTREMLGGCFVSEIHFPDGWCEETRSQRVHEWYRSLKTRYAIVTDVDELVDPVDRLLAYAESFPDCDVLLGKAVNCVSLSRGVFAVRNPTKPVLMKTGLEKLQLSYACHRVYGVRTLEVPVYMKHMMYENYPVMLKRHLSRVGGGEHWRWSREAFDADWNKAQMEAVTL